MEFHRMPGHLVRRLNQISTGLFMERMASAGLTLTPVQFAALNALADRPGIDQATLAGMVAYDRATLGKVVDRLEERGALRRDVSPTDRRARVLELTEAGHALYQSALPHVQAIQPQILTGLNEEERARLIELLEKVTMAGNDMSRAPLRPPED
ncbi:MarR family winged helix-turn-helix transcriptional regulator [Seohaeicola zhoushanensis]|uniref:Transcriptional regulator n=1 Tax=Seohaeicola zhoushanensis TaxID=1569283 RepID=A0A8J3H270_9RHOB|nr:MarR family transcriptional regulator [Seohaeicola zhoushanensis]GHF66689.1 transcriptional regulator [Seohaeicola zhoushanensis]